MNGRVKSTVSTEGPRRAAVNNLSDDGDAVVVGGIKLLERVEKAPNVTAPCLTTVHPALSSDQASAQ